MPPPAPEDRPETAPRKIRAGKYAHSREEIEARLLAYGISQRSLDERFILVQGFFPEGFERYSGKPIALLHLDVDLYRSHKDCLEWLEPLVAPGGVIAFDEYRNPHLARRDAGDRRVLRGSTTGSPEGSRLEPVVPGQELGDSQVPQPSCGA
jgi:predicted O-methyltransferase YrrM